MSETQDQGTTKRDETAKPQAAARPPGPSLGRLLGCLGVVVALLLLCGTAFVLGVFFGAPLQDANQGIRTLLTGEQPVAAAEEDDWRYYTCGMHPWVIVPEAGLCPICHMDLVPLDPEKFTGEIAIDPVVVQNIGVRIEPVTRGPLVRTIRTVGSVDYDETGVRDVNIKVSGWIEKLYVDYLGQEVEAGQPLFEIYSPDLYAAQQEYLLAYDNQDRIGAEFLPDAAAGARDLLEAARIKLEYFDVTPQQIEALQRSGKPAKTMTIVSPHRGVVIAKHANEGMRVDPGMQVYRIADLSTVWIMVSLYEYQLPFVEVGQPAVMTLSYIPGRTFQGKVIFIYPYLDKKTRQINVRLEFDNPTGLLKPGMYANIKLQRTLAQSRTLVPRAAVMDTGKRRIAYVSLGEGRFEPREVQVGVETDDGMIEILDGLMPGEMVVTSGQFLLDSEANIREALAKMIKGQPASEQEAVGVVAGPSQLSALPDAAADAIVEILDGYFALGDTFAGDSVGDLSPVAGRIAGAVDVLLDVEIPDDEEFWRKHDEVATVRSIALELVDETDLEQARLQFADLSAALAKLIKATGVPPSYPTQVHQLHCPMYRSEEGGSIWLQPKGDVRNPFYGSMMLTCFDVRTILPVTGRSEPTE
ncbi:MAG: efflux RND transporter periplasmic adaptor subunit [Planctomycetes bacterium]|nr:efflux RND transporter periplasmic adaptor subunit [Planctomycetota bacterium]